MGRTFQIKRTEKAEVLKWKLTYKGDSGWSRAVRGREHLSLGGEGGVGL